MDAITMLKEQHRQVAKLFAMIEKEKPGARRAALLRELTDALAAHCTIEEHIFYPSVMTDATEKQLREAVEEHLSAKRVIADLLRGGLDEAKLDAKVKVLKEQIEHHVKEEEAQLFPRVSTKQPREYLEELGARMESLFAQLQQGAPREAVTDETDEPAPLPEPRPHG